MTCIQQKFGFQNKMPAVVGMRLQIDVLISALPMSRTVEGFVQCYLNIEKNNTIEDTIMILQIIL